MSADGLSPRSVGPGRSTGTASEPKWAQFRAQFPVFEHRRYLNAGIEGPVPAAAAAAARAVLERSERFGRADPGYLEELLSAAARLRAAYARVLGASESCVALTESTTAGVNSVLGGLAFRAGDEIVTSDQEHPGLLAPLRRLSVRCGVTVRVVPFRSVADAVGPATRLIACSHVAWVGGEVADVASLVGSGVPVLLDGAQALGAIPVDVAALGVDFYAASGQKWLCGPEGSGVLFVRADRLDDLEPAWPGYGAVAAPGDALVSGLAPGAARLDTSFPSWLRSAWALASLEVLESAGWGWCHGRASFMAASLAAGLAARGLTVAPRGASTLVSWTPPGGLDVDAEVARLAAAGILVRSIPSHGLLRASCGAWTAEEDVAALLALAS